MKWKFLFPGFLVSMTPLAAEPRPISADSEIAWQHEWTSARLLPRIGSFKRVSLEDYGTQRVDVVAGYRDRASATAANVYLFRASPVDVSIWQDRMFTMMASDELVGALDKTSVVAASFTPGSGAGKDSGYIVYGAVSGKKARSTGFALLPHDGWLIAVRMTSQDMSAADLGEQLTSFVAGVELPRAKVSYPAASAIAECPRPLSFEGDAPRATFQRQASVVLNVIATNRGKKTDGAPVTSAKAVKWCRDPSSTTSYGVYRRKEHKNAYLIAFRDGGASAEVGRVRLDPWLDAGGSFWIRFTDPDRTLNYAPFTSLPSPEEVEAAMQKEEPFSAVLQAPGGGSRTYMASEYIQGWEKD
ncbi:hypothetical protein [Altericroceibacterium xinjiangense]|uniref:hypothetical protein n=1 Tax=Altericroceibacterium xinjiangense TaxID=762261 RepID=UPI000F7F30CC|nr:hypothetical protein [Altericroceibacterium xinjiangense]